MPHVRVSGLTATPYIAAEGLPPQMLPDHSSEEPIMYRLALA